MRDYVLRTKHFGVLPSNLCLPRGRKFKEYPWIEPSPRDITDNSTSYGQGSCAERVRQLGGACGRDWTDLLAGLW